MMDALINEMQAHISSQRQYIDQDFLRDVLKRAGSNDSSLLEWILVSSDAYTSQRALAGLELLKRSTEQAWHVLQNLIGSADPDDRDAALATLILVDDQRGYALAKPMLHDEWPYLRLDATEFLQKIYPSEVVSALQTLLSHSEEWVRKAAQEQLNQIAPHDV